MILKGWKDIAKYLGCGVRTAQRWEAALALPVRRLSYGPGSAVIALHKDINTWLRNKSRKRSTPAYPGESSRKFQYRILIADSDEKLLTTLSAVLMREDYEVRTACDGFEVLAVMRDSLPDLLISDFLMPNMSGFELLGVVRQRFPAISVIAYSNEFTPVKAEDVLCDVHLKKAPKSHTKLLAAVRDLLAHSPLRSQPAKLEGSAVPLSIPTKGSIALTCPNCLRSFPLKERSTVIGKDAATPCRDCGAEIRYHVSDSNLSIANDLNEIRQHSRQRRHSEI